MGCRRWKWKLNAIVYRNRALNKRAHRLYCSLEEIRCILCGKSNRDRGRICRK